MRDLLKSTLIDSGCRPDVADHVIGHAPKDSYEKQAFLYPENVRTEFAKASDRINVLDIAESLRNKKHANDKELIHVEASLIEDLIRVNTQLCDILLQIQRTAKISLTKHAPQSTNDTDMTRNANTQS